MKMYEEKLISTCWTSVLLITTMCTSWVNAAETKNYGMASQGYATSGPADALFYLTDPDRPYVLIVIEQQVPLICVGRAYYQGECGLNASLVMESVIGFASMVNNKIYFFNSEGCSAVIPVQNSNTTVHGYKNFYGSFLYQAFAALLSNCTYYCNTCSTSELNNDPSQASTGRGGAVVNLGNIQGFSMISTDSSSVPSLMKKLNARLSQNSVPDYTIQPCCDQCVTIVKQNPFLTTCPLATKVLTSSNVRNSITNPSFIQKNQFCSITISQAKELQAKSQPVFATYRYILPTISNTLVIISCYSTFQVFNILAETYFNFCG